MTTKKQVNAVLVSKKGGKHADKRDDLDKRIQSEQLREFIRALRKKVPQ